jgi:hypothetical protein
MKHIFYSLTFSLGGMVLTADQAFAQQTPCADRAMVIAQLADRYGESRQAIGLSNSNRVLEVYASPETGTWTITLTQPGGPTCLVAAGQGFELNLEPLPVDDSGA